ncbi:MAG: ribonuclease D [Coriobacteriia bacterium]|nr:ribonuclease D [Coriobacteriia bacterium]
MRGPCAYVYITDSQALSSFVASISDAKVIVIDTEFMREKTYYAKLCLIQIGVGEVIAAIDPLAISDLGPLWRLLERPEITKVFHAGSQDVEILYREMGMTPAPVFDTQIAATLTGQPAQVGYGQLVRSVLGVELDKGDSFTDWSARPLKQTQIEYALNDVRYLTELYTRLHNQLVEAGRLAWLSQDFERMADPATYDIVPEEQWRRVKRASSLDRKALAVLRSVAAWRELEAQRRDLPKRWVIGDESLIEVARRAPQDSASLSAIRGLGDRAVGRFGSGIIAAVADGLAVPEEERPRLAKRKRGPKAAAQLSDLLGVLVRIRARDHGVAPTLLATRDEIESFAEGERENSPLMVGWRHTLVGAELEALVRGDISLRVSDGEVVVEQH